MRGPRVRTGIRAALAVAVLWAAAFALACRRAAPSADALTAGGRIGLAAARAIDASRAAAGNQFFKNADRTFHMGVGVYRPAAITSWFTRLGRVIAPEEHRHLHGENVNEMLPWLYFAVRANPHDVNAYVVAAFWLAGEGGRPDLAAQVLDEARANNPQDYRVYLEKGRLALKMGRPPEAARALDSAARLWDRDPGPDEVQARLDRAEMLVYRGLLHEDSGNVPAALACYREILELYPERSGIGKRIAELARDGRAGVPPADMWQVIIFQRRHVCDREHAEGAAGH